MKKVVALLAVATIVISFTGCKSTNHGNSSTTSNTDFSTIENSETKNSSLQEDEIITMASFENTVAVIKNDHTLWMWGTNDYGQIGNGTKDKVTSPVKVLDDVIFVSVGWNNSAAIKSDHSLWVWGFNKDGELGSLEVGNDQSDKGFNIQTTPIKVMENVLSVSVGECNMAVITTDHSLWLWGKNDYGQIGNGLNSRFEPATKIMDDVKCVEFGDGNVIAVKSDDSLWTWGNNFSGSLGNETNGSLDVYQTTPIKVLDGVRLTKNAGFWGFQNTLAITKDNSLYVWGANQYGQVGTGTDGNGKDAWDRPAQTIPAKILDNVSKVSASRVYNNNYVVMSAITNDNSLYAWGLNDFGMVGNGSTENVVCPTFIMDNVSDAIVNCNVGIALKIDGGVWIWGKLKNDTNPVLSPMKIADNAKSIYSARIRGVYFIKDDGLLYQYNTVSETVERVFG